MQKINWPKIIYKLKYYHSIIYNTRFKSRHLRDYQRLMRKSFHYKVLLIYLILNNSCIEPICTAKFSQLKYIHSIHEFNKLQIDWPLMHNVKYRLFLTQQINLILSILCYFSVFEKINNLSLIGLSSSKYTTSNHSHCNQSLINLFLNTLHCHQWFCFVHFKLELKQPLKYWLFHQLLMESKIVILWFLKLPHYHKSEFVQLQKRMMIGISDYIKVLYIYYIIRLLKIEIFNYLYYIDTLILVNSHDYVLKQYQFALDKGTHLHVQYCTSYNMCNGFTWFGWFIKCQANNIHKSVSRYNIRAHQTELTQFLKRSGIYTLDKVILLLNKKILLWQSFYLSEYVNPKLEFHLNKYLFWRIWYFLKKRYKNKGSKWIIKRYFKFNAITKKWNLISNNITLISYHCLHSCVKRL